MSGFLAKIFRLGINPVVDVPDDALLDIIEKAGRVKGPIPVCGRLNGVEYIQTLVKYQSAWRLYINGGMLKASGLKVGDAAAVEIEYDPRPREVPVPPELERALVGSRVARDAFDALARSRQTEILRYLGSLKTPESIERNVAKIIAQLAGDDSDKSHIAMRQGRKSK